MIKSRAVVPLCECFLGQLGSVFVESLITVM